MIDALAFESQFLDHLAPLWAALAPELRGTFAVHESLAERAGRVDAELVPYPLKLAKPRDRIALVASLGDIKKGRLMGYRRFIFLEHGIGQSYGGGRLGGSYAGGPGRDDVVLNLVPNETCAQAWRAAYPDTPTVVIGCPKLDELPQRIAAGAPTVAISFHWPAEMISPYAGTALPDFLPALRPLAERFLVVGHAHPRGNWPDRMNRHYRAAGISFLRDFEDVCRVADLYICDNSSTLYEFAATGRPVVVMNAKAWTRDVDYGLRFWEAAGIGMNVDRWPDLVPTVGEALDDPPIWRERRQDALELVYQPGLTGAAQRGADAIASFA